MKKFLIKAVVIWGILFISLSTVAYFLYDTYEPNALVKSQSINIRSNPTTSEEKSSVLITLERGDTLEVLKVSNEPIDGYIWAQVKFIDSEGKINRGFCVYDFLVISKEPQLSEK